MLNDQRGQNFGKILISLLVVVILGAVFAGFFVGLDFGAGSTVNTATTIPDTTEISTTTIATKSTPSTEIPTPTHTISPTITRTQTFTTSPTVTPTTSTKSRYEDFGKEMTGALNRSSRTPLRIRGATVEGDVMYLVHNATAANENATKKYVEWGDIAVAYSAAVKDTKHLYNNSDVPSRMVLYEVNSSNLETEPAKFTVTTEDSMAWENGEIDSYEFTKRWQDTIEPQYPEDEEHAIEIDQQKVNFTFYPNKPYEKGE